MQYRNIELPTSKSLLARYIVAGYAYNPAASIKFGDLSEDSSKMLAATEQLKALRNSDEESPIFSLGMGGTTFRFLAPFIFTTNQKAQIFLDPQLLARPHTGLTQCLEKLGMPISIPDNPKLPVTAQEQPYHVPTATSLEVNLMHTSQILTAMLLYIPYYLIQARSRGATQGKYFEITTSSAPPNMRNDYVDMTCGVLQQFGIHWKPYPSKSITAEGIWPSYRLETASLPQFWPRSAAFAPSVIVESDLSAAVVMILIASLSGKNLNLNGSFPAGNGNSLSESWQPEAKLINALISWGFPIDIADSQIKVTGYHWNPNTQAQFFPQEIDCRHFPDSMMIIAVMFLMLNRPVRLLGSEHNQFKESDRVRGFASQLQSAGYDITVENGNFAIRETSWPLPGSKKTTQASPRVWHTHRDHRLIMAFTLLCLPIPGLYGSGGSVDENLGIEKSYPSFLDHLHTVFFK